MDNRDLAVSGQKVYETICRMFEREELHYSKDDNDMTVSCELRGDGFPVEVNFVVRPDRELVQVLSFIPFNVKEDKRLEMALVLTVLNDRFVNGSFDYNMAKGRIVFRMAESYKGCAMSMDVFEYMFRVAVSTVSNYVDKLLMISKGLMSFEEFLDSEDD